MKKNNKRQGFTLIELMVVISIITLFASITFASLTGVRARAQEATIKSELKSVKSQAELSYNNTGDYSTAGSAVSAIIDGINTGGGTAAFYTYDNTHYAVSVRLNSNPSKNWSVSDQANPVTWDTADRPNNSWANAKTDCTNSGGRLPTVEELEALQNAYGVRGLIALGFSGTYWSGTETSTDYAWGVDSVLGQMSNNYKPGASHVRCVR